MLYSSKDLQDLAQLAVDDIQADCVLLSWEVQVLSAEAKLIVYYRYRDLTNVPFGVMSTYITLG